MTLEYSKTVPFRGRAPRALDVARAALVGQSFEIVASGERELRVKGPGMTSTRESPLKGVSEAAFVARDDSIEVRALLGGAEKMKRFLRLFPLGLFLFFLVVFGVLAWQVPVLRHAWIFLIPALALSPWLFLAPLIGRSIENRTRQALDTLLSNMLMMGRDD